MERIDKDYDYEYDYNYPSDKNKQPQGKYILGLILIAAGVLFLLRNLNFLPYFVEDIIFSWQAIIIAIGLFLTTKNHKRHVGIIMIAVGTFFMIPEIIPFNFPVRKLFWPVVLLGVGILFIIKKPKLHKRYRHNDPQTYSNDYIDELAIFGGSEKIITSNAFSGGKATAIFGGCELNFLNSDLNEVPVEVEITAIFGGVNLIVPADWNVKVDVTPILGGFADSRHKTGYTEIDYTKELIIRGTVIFGGGEIKSI